MQSMYESCLYNVLYKYRTNNINKQNTEKRENAIRIFKKSKIKIIEISARST